MNLAQFLGLPMTAGPRDMPMGEDELGNVLYAAGGTPKGQRYTKKTAPANKTSVVKSLAGQAKADPVGTMGGILKGAAQGAWGAFSAPGRAASGENVTMGDVADVAGMVSLPALAGKYDPAVANMGIRAYHGSPHDFDRFSMDKIGTGEGAQAYGHGLYFAEAEDVAREYRDALSPSMAVDGKPVMHGNAADTLERALLDAGLPEKVADDARWYVNRGYSPDEFISDLKKSDPEAAARVGEIWRATESQGHMYEVDINADPADFLDWDAPFSSADDVERFASKFDATDPALRKRIEDYGYMRQEMGQPMPDGNDIIREILGGVGNADARAASRVMSEAGIPGIKYRDAGSRGIDGAEGISRNYVVFDDSLIDIIRKYGLAGAAPLGAILGAQDDEKQRIRDFLSQ